MKLGYTANTKDKRIRKYYDSPPLKKMKSIKSVGKIMASIFWDVKGILMIVYFPIGSIINEQNCATLLYQLDKNIH